MSVMNGTGPLGMGPQTGRGLGHCSGRQSFQGQGRGINCRRPMGFGRGARLSEDFSIEVDKKALMEKEKKMLEARLEEINHILED